MGNYGFTERKSTTLEFAKAYTSVLGDNKQNISNDTKDSRVSQIRLSNLQTKNMESDIDVPLSQSCKVNDKLLKGTVFVSVSFSKFFSYSKKQTKCLNIYILCQIKNIKCYLALKIHLV